jgi:hypothetical protein
MRKISPPPGFDPRTVQPVASRYTDYAIPAPGQGPTVKLIVAERANKISIRHLLNAKNPLMVKLLRKINSIYTSISQVFTVIYFYFI